MNAVLKRELKSYFSSPIGYVCIAILLAIYGFNFYMVMMYRMSSAITSVYSTMFMWNMIIIPILTMKSISDEKRNKTDQALLTAPVGVTSIVLGKFLAALCIFAIALAGSLIPVVIISFYAKLGWALIFGDILGSLFYGAAMISIGVFISSLTESQIIAAILTFAASIFLVMMDMLTSISNNAVVTAVINWISFNTRYQTFTKGMFDLSSVVFFLSVAAVFVFLTARRLESRRWS